MGSCHSRANNKVKSKVFPGERVRYIKYKGSVEVLSHFSVCIKAINLLNLSHVVNHRIVDYCRCRIKIMHINEFSPLTNIHKYKYVEYNRILVQICYGILLLNNSNVIHGNLKPSNVLIGDDYQISVADYLINTVRTNSENNIKILQYLSPEQLSSKEVTVKTDIWGIGLILFFLLTGRSLAYFNYTEMMELMNVSEIITNEKIKVMFIELFKRTMEYNPKERISVTEILYELDNLNIVEARYYSAHKYKGFIVFNNLKWLFSYLLVASDDKLTEEIVNQFDKNPSNRLLFLIINMIWAKRDSSFLRSSFRNAEIRNDIFAKNGLVMRCVKTPYCILLNGYDLRKLKFNIMVDCFKYVSLLQYLDLRQSHLEPNMMKMIVEQIGLLRNLKTMRIDNNPNNNDSMRYIKRHLNILIDYNLWGEAAVSFYNMSIKDTGLKYITKNLRYMRRVKILDLASNNITNEGITDLADNISVLYHLKQLSLQWNDFDDCNSIDKILESCSSLTVSVSKCSFDYFLIDDLKLKWDKRLDFDNIDLIR